MNKNKRRNIKYCTLVIFTCVFMFFIVSCQGLVEVEGPYTSINSKNVYTSNETAISVLNGLYSTLMVGNSTGNRNITTLSLYCGMASDELTLFDSQNQSPNYSSYYTNSLTNQTSNHWSSTYSNIFITNSVIENLKDNDVLSSYVTKQLLGEAKFMRALLYFYLVNTFGDVPLVLSTDPDINIQLPRSSIEVIYKQILLDLTDAETLLSEKFLNGTLSGNSEERIRPNKWAASALLARVYLYTKNYKSALVKATSVIQNTALFNLVSLNDVFLKNSRETILQFQCVRSGNDANTGDGKTFILPSTGPNTSDNPVYLSSYVLNTFETGDERKTNWADSIITPDKNVYYFPYKYKASAANTTNSEYLMVLRLSEQYLIRAEALAQENNLDGALEDLNLIRHRAGLIGKTASSKEDLLALIMHERRVELFTEWGHRWFDLKRTDSANVIMPTITSEKGGIWNSDWQLFPILLSELNNDNKLVQNPGY